MAIICSKLQIRVYPAREGGLRPHVVGNGNRIVRDAGLSGDIVRYAAGARVQDFPFTMAEHPGITIDHSSHGVHCVIDNSLPDDSLVQEVMNQLKVWQVAVSIFVTETDIIPDQQGPIGLVSSLEQLPAAGRYIPDRSKPSAFGTVYDHSGHHGVFVRPGTAEVRSWSPDISTAAKVAGQLAGIAL